MRILVEESMLPAIWINSKHEKNCVYPDDCTGSFELTERIISSGHKRIAFLDFIGGTHYSIIDRKNGYEAAMIAHRLKPNSILLDNQKNKAVSLSDSRKILGSRNRPSAIITYTPESAWWLHSAAFELKIKIPDELLLASFDARPITHTNTELATAIIPEGEIGVEAVNALLRLINKESKSVDPIAVKYNSFVGLENSLLNKKYKKNNQ